MAKIIEKDGQKVVVVVTMEEIQELRSLELEVEALKSHAKKMEDRYVEACCKIEKMEGDMEKMREVLEFYAHTDQDEQAKQVLEEIDK